MAQAVDTKRPVLKSAARLLSFGGTFGLLAAGGVIFTSQPSGEGVPLGICVGAMGLVLGPGLGHAYAHNGSRFAKGTLLRLAAAGGCGLLGFVMFDEGFELFDGNSGMIAGGIMVWSIGTTILLWSAIHDMVSVGRSVDKYNASIGYRGIEIGPTYFVQHKAIGLSASVGF
jgi:hypothetical protein